MGRRAFMAGVAGLLAAPRAAETQPAAKVWRIGYLTMPSRETAHGVADTFQRALSDLGWIEGQNVVLDYRFADSNMARCRISRPRWCVSGRTSLLRERTRR
jgi:putative ABC transport system substrate-binding protein